MSSTRRPDLNGRASQARTKALVARSLPLCWLCGLVIDTSLSGNDQHGPTRHHKTPVNLGGHPTDDTNEALAHRRCNDLAGDLPAEHSQAHVRNVLGIADTPHTRDWGIR